MVLESLHPGVTVEEIQENSSFPIHIPEEVIFTPPPSRDDVELLRELDPTGMAIGK